MAAIDVNQVCVDMLAAARDVFAARWPTIKDFAEAEFEKLARTLSQIEKLRATDQISEAEASVLFEMQKNTARSVMLALEGMSLIVVEAAVNAALAAVKKTVNTTLGFALI